MAENPSAVWLRINEGEALLPPMYYHTSKAINSRNIVVFGGSGNNQIVLGESYVLKLEKGIAQSPSQSIFKCSVEYVVQSDPASVQPRFSAVSTLVPRDASSDYMVTFGGVSFGQSFTNVFWYSTTKKAWTVVPAVGDTPVGGETYSMTSLDNMIYVLPGGPSTNGRVYGMRPNDCRWCVMECPFLRTGLWTVFSDGRSKLIFLGCPEGDEFSKEVQEYDISTADSSKHPCRGSPPKYRAGIAAAVCEYRFVVFYGGWSGEPVANLDVYDMYSRTWKSVTLPIEGSNPGPRFGSTLCSLTGKDFIMIGGRTGAGRCGDIWHLKFNQNLSSYFVADERPPVQRTVPMRNNEWVAGQNNVAGARSGEKQSDRPLVPWYTPPGSLNDKTSVDILLQLLTSIPSRTYTSKETADILACMEKAKEFLEKKK